MIQSQGMALFFFIFSSLVLSLLVHILSSPFLLHFFSISSTSLSLSSSQLQMDGSLGAMPPRLGLPMATPTKKIVQLSSSPSPILIPSLPQNTSVQMYLVHFNATVTMVLYLEAVTFAFSQIYIKRTTNHGSIFQSTTKTQQAKVTPLSQVHNSSQQRKSKCMQLCEKKKIQQKRNFE